MLFYLISGRIIWTYPLILPLTMSPSIFTLSEKTYSIGFTCPTEPGLDHTSESYEWVTETESVENWSTLVTSHKLSPLSPDVPLSVEQFAQNTVAMNEQKGAMILETSIINTPDAIESGIDINNPPFLLIYIFPSPDGIVPAEMNYQKIENGSGGNINALIFAVKLNIFTQEDLQSFITSESFASYRYNIIRAIFPY